MPIFNEKAVLRLGRGMEATGCLNEEGITQALLTLRRFYLVAKGMGVTPFDVLATAAVRDAKNGQEFVEAVRFAMPNVPIHVLTGQEEAYYSAEGVVGGIPTANGLLADIGGGSLEVLQLLDGQKGNSASIRLGVIRLAERSGYNLLRARSIAEDDLSQFPWLRARDGADLFLVGGAWRALARIHIVLSNYPLNIVHHYSITRDEAIDLTDVISGANRKLLERLPGIARRRIEDLPYAAIVLRRLLRDVSPRRIIFSASGLREGWCMQHLPESIRQEEPLISAAVELCARHGRDTALPTALVEWTAPLFPSERPADTRLRMAACWMSDIGSHDHPEFRAEQAFFRVLRQPGVGLDHHARAFLALAIAVRYDASIDASFLCSARRLLDLNAAKRAEILGSALRLAYTLSGGTRELLKGTGLNIEGNYLILMLGHTNGDLTGDTILRRLYRLAQSSGLEGKVREIAN
jgi:exopolyphosphatase/guanosine-5'-triphosphate,3'-diphosphate pyrophosphatase